MALVSLHQTSTVNESLVCARPCPGPAQLYITWLVIEGEAMEVLVQEDGAADLLHPDSAAEAAVVPSGCLQGVQKHRLDKSAFGSRGCCS